MDEAYVIPRPRQQEKHCTGSLSVTAVFNTERHKYCHSKRKVDAKVVDGAYVIPRFSRLEMQCIHSLSVTAISITERHKNCYYGRKVDSEMTDEAYVIPRPSREEMHLTDTWQKSSSQKDKKNVPTDEK